MNLLKTRAIALHHTRYSDNSAIGKFFTRDLGMRAVMIRSVYRKKGSQSNLIRPFTLLDVEVRESTKSDILTAVNLERACPQSGFQGEFLKSAVVMFLAELLNKSLEESYINERLFDFVWQAILILDQDELNPNFHLVFLVELIKHYGMYPQLPTSPRDRFLDMEGGIYQDHRGGNYCLDESTSELLLAILGTDFEGVGSLEISAVERQAGLRSLVDYLRIHVSGLNEINSQTVLETVFHG